MYQPEEYERFKSYCIRDANIFFPQMVNAMKWCDNEIIVDYGCGAGSTGCKHILPHVKRNNSTMLSVDASEEMIDYAKAHYPDPSVKYFVGNILTDDNIFTCDEVDKIFSFYVLHFVNSLSEFLNRVKRALKPQGYLAFTAVTKSPLFEIFKVLVGHQRWKKYMKSYKRVLPYWVTENCDPSIEINKELVQAGYNILHVETYTMKYKFDSLDQIIGLYTSASPFTREVPVHLHNDLKQEYKNCLTGNLANVDPEMCTIKYDVLIAVVQKPKFSIT